MLQYPQRTQNQIQVNSDFFLSVTYILYDWLIIESDLYKTSYYFIDCCNFWSSCVSIFGGFTLFSVVSSTADDFIVAVVDGVGILLLPLIVVIAKLLGGPFGILS
jgi:hypothetical protein